MDARGKQAPKAPFGVTGLDEVLGGGLARNRLYLLEGTSGSGKTTLAVQFLLQGALGTEKGLYITLSETEQELRESGWSFLTRSTSSSCCRLKIYWTKSSSKVCCIRRTLS